MDGREAIPLNGSKLQMEGLDMSQERKRYEELSEILNEAIYVREKIRIAFTAINKLCDRLEKETGTK